MIAPSDKPLRAHHIAVRVSEQERALLVRAAQAVDRTVADYCRAMALREARAVVAAEADAQAA